MKKWFAVLALPIAASVITLGAQDPQQDIPNTNFRHSFNIVEATIPEMQAALESGRVTSRELVLLYMTRIAQYEDLLNATAYVSRTALDEAEELDRERANGRIRGPLHGIPIALKDIINTTNMPTTGGAVALEGFVPPYEATLVTNLKRAGAVIIAKTVLTELANWVTTGMPANYSGLLGYGMNPYDPRRDPRDGTNDGRPVMATGGSSSGIGTTANFWAGSVGTETSGSILSPSNQNMLVGIKPTVGLISRWGIIPITADQDTAGPMTRTVTDAAILLGGMVGQDSNDAATNRCVPPAGNDYTRHLLRAGLRGARIGIPRANYYRPTTRPDSGATVGGLGAPQLALMEEAIQILRAEGATIVDPADIPSIVDGTPANNFLTFGVCSGLANRKGSDSACSVVLKYGMKRDFNLWASSLGPGAPIRNLTELREYNLANRPRNTIKYEQQNLDISDEMDLAGDRARWQADRNKDIFLAATHGIDEVMARNNLDALLFPGSSSAGIAAKAGHPTVIVPLGFIPNPAANLPAGFNPKNQPYGISFTGTACTEGRLIELAYAFEQATKRRVAPASAP
ncbi:MAG TPA: amidase family protein [Vicinamibacterales bacterium]|nr:amidase family protein [Vicinamibacterales bacterium]